MCGETFYGRHTTQHLLQCSKKKSKGLPLETKNTKLTKIGDSVLFSLFKCNTVICKIAYAPSTGFSGKLSTRIRFTIAL